MRIKWILIIIYTNFLCISRVAAATTYFVHEVHAARLMRV